MSLKTLFVRASQTDLNNKNPAQCSSRLGRYHGMDQGSELELSDRKHENFIRPDCLQGPLGFWHPEMPKPCGDHEEA